MLKKYLLMLTLLLTVFYGRAQLAADTTAHTNTDSLMATVDHFVSCLSQGQKLSPLMSSKWSFIYHEDNRCDGSTNGSLTNLSDYQIDNVIKIKVTNNGDGWGCDKRPVSTYYLDFSLSKSVEKWDRFENAPYNQPEKKLFRILGGGESDYLIVYYELMGGKYLIVKLEYHSEDPG